MLQISFERDNRIIYFDELDIVSAETSSRYNEDGAGFLELDLELSISPTDSDVKVLMGDYVIARKYSSIVYRGHVVAVGMDNSKDILDVVCMGEISTFEEEEFFWVVSDNRTASWKARNERPADLFRPDLFDITQSEKSMSFSPTGDTIPQYAFTVAEYEFKNGEYAKKMISSLVGISNGNGILFESEIVTVDSGAGTLTHSASADVSYLEGGDVMTLWNVTQDSDVTITTVGTPTNGFTVNGDISDWAVADAIYVYGPAFKALVSAIAGAVITYVPEYGEANLSAGDLLVNTSQRQVAVISSVDTGANTITIDNEDDIEEWGEGFASDYGDEISVCVPIFRADIYATPSDENIEIENEIGFNIVNSAGGWILYNADRGEVATVVSFLDATPKVVVVTQYSDVSSWLIGETVQIHSPFRIGVLDEYGNTLYPPSDWRDWSIPQRDNSFDYENDASILTKIHIYYQCLVGGEANDYTFAQIKDPVIRSTIEDPNIERYLEQFVPQTTFGISQSIDYLSLGGLVASNDPCLVEQGSPLSFLKSMADFGDTAGERVVWGVTKDNLVFVKSIPSSDERITMIVDASEAEFDIDSSDSVQIVRASYSDSYGNRILTDWNDSEIRINDRYTRKTIDVQTTSSTDANKIVGIQLSINSNPKYSIKIKVSPDGLYYQNGARVIPSQIIAEFQNIVFDGSLPKDVSERGGKDGGNFFFVGNAEEIQVDLLTDEIEITLAKDDNEAERIFSSISRISNQVKQVVGGGSSL